MVVRHPAGTRRRFLKALAAVGGAALAGARRADAGVRPLFSAIGITAKVERAAALKAAGADFLVESAADFLVPFAGDAAFAANRARAAASELPIRGCNSFMRDPSLVCVGPRADHVRVIAYAATAFARLQAIGGEYIVFGSNTARRIPDGWSKAQADTQFIELLKRMAPLAERHGITVGVEMQRTSECNYLNHIEEVVGVVAPVNHANIRVLADLFHMRVMGDSPQQLERAMPWVGLVELAEREQRTLPGIAGDDFRPYFAALSRGQYRGLVDIEGDGTPEELRNAFATVKIQARDAEMRE
ncbi:MAG TPA: TIM barrel protein [Steroidobacteraceae bacterium]